MSQRGKDLLTANSKGQTGSRSPSACHWLAHRGCHSPRAYISGDFSIKNSFKGNFYFSLLWITQVCSGRCTPYCRLYASSPPLRASNWQRCSVVNTKEGEGTRSLHVPYNKYPFAFRHDYLEPMTMGMFSSG